MTWKEVKLSLFQMETTSLICKNLLINDLSVRAKTRKVLEEITGVNIHDFIFGNGLNS